MPRQVDVEDRGKSRSRPPQLKPHPVFRTLAANEYGRTRAALVRAGIPNIPSIIGRAHSELTKSEVARRIIAL